MSESSASQTSSGTELTTVVSGIQAAVSVAARRRPMPPRPT